MAIVSAIGSVINAIIGVRPLSPARARTNVEAASFLILRGCLEDRTDPLLDARRASPRSSWPSSRASATSSAAAAAAAGEALASPPSASARTSSSPSPFLALSILFSSSILSHPTRTLPSQHPSDTPSPTASRCNALLLTSPRRGLRKELERASASTFRKPLCTRRDLVQLLTLESYAQDWLLQMSGQQRRGERERGGTSTLGERVGSDVQSPSARRTSERSLI